MAKGQCDLAFAMVALMLRRAPIAAVARSIGRYPPCNKMYHIEELPTRTSRNCALPSSLQREGLEQLRGYESEDERRCMIEREYAGCEHGLLATRPLPSALPSPLPFKGIRGSAEGRRHRRPQDSERVPCRPIVSR